MGPAYHHNSADEKIYPPIIKITVLNFLHQLINKYSLLLTRISPTIINRTPATALTYFNAFDAFLIKINRKLIKIDRTIKGRANPAE